MKDRLLSVLLNLMESKFTQISKPLRKNLAYLTAAFVGVLAAVRSGNGCLSLAALVRGLPIEGNFRKREKRLHRFLSNRHLDYRSVTSSLTPLLVGKRSGFCPILLDQTKSGPVQALLAAVPYAGRALPLACYTFGYPLSESSFLSQNQLEHIFILDTEQALPLGIAPVWIADRGYARSLLLEQSEKEGRAYIIRGRCGTVITFRGIRMKLCQLKAKPYHALRYENIEYHAQRKVLIDVVVYHEPSYKETWYLLVPVGCRSLLSPLEVVRLYRERMQIEQSFRDFKTHLGLRGLKLKVDVVARMGRLLLAFLLAYTLCILLGESKLGQNARKIFEATRRTPRHGTTRTLSALMMAMLMLSHMDFRNRCIIFIIKIINRVTTGHTWLPKKLLAVP